MKYFTHAPVSKETLMLEYYSLVKIVAKKLLNRLPSSIELDDLISAGLIGLMQSIERFKPEKGFKFKTYAEFRIRGAMLDELRSQDWAPKGMRQKAKQFERICEKIQQNKGRKATETEIRQALHLNRTRFEQLVRDVNTLEQMNLSSYSRMSDDEGTSPMIELVPDLDANPFAEASQRNTRECLAEALQQLPEAERNVLTLYYFEELNLREIGKRLEISESRACQLHAKAIVSLKRNISEETTQLMAA